MIGLLNLSVFSFVVFHYKPKGSRKGYLFQEHHCLCFCACVYLCLCPDLTCKHPTLPKKTKGKEKMLEARTWAGSKDMGCSPEDDCEDGKEYWLINDGTIMSKICDYLQNDKDLRSRVESPLQVPGTQSLRSEAPVPRSGLVSGRKRCILFTFFQTT